MRILIRYLALASALRHKPNKRYYDFLLLSFSMFKMFGKFGISFVFAVLWCVWQSLSEIFRLYLHSWVGFASDFVRMMHVLKMKALCDQHAIIIHVSVLFLNFVPTKFHRQAKGDRTCIKSKNFRCMKHQRLCEKTPTWFNSSAVFTSVFLHFFDSFFH